MDKKNNVLEYTMKHAMDNNLLNGFPLYGVAEEWYSRKNKQTTKEFKSLVPNGDGKYVTKPRYHRIWEQFVASSLDI